MLLITGLQLSVTAQEDVLRVETNLVSLNVAVTDKKGNYVRGLTREQFVVTDSGVRQDIETFAAESSPASIGIVYDMHPGSREQTASVIDALRQFTQKLGQRDRYFVNVFGNNGSLTTEFVPTMEQIRDFVENGDPKRSLSLYDAIFAASKKVSTMENPKRILIILTEGADHNSMHSLKELRMHLRSVNLPVYSVTFGRDNRRMYGYADLYRSGPRQTFDPFETSQLDRGVIAEISKSTGGQSFEGNVRNRYYLTALCDKVLKDISNQYVIGFYPESPDGKWHKLKVTIAGPGARTYRVASRRGYQSPAVKRR